MNVLSKLLGGPSPFAQLLLHLDKAMECVDLIEPIVEAALAGDEERVKEIGSRIYKLEHEADEIKNSIRDNLPRDLFMPVSRLDYLSLLREQDSLADKAEDLATMLSIRKLRMPDDCEQGPCEMEFRELATHSVVAARSVASMIRRIDKLKNAGFKGPIAEEIREAAVIVGDLEYKSDKNQYRLIRTLLTMDESNWSFAETYVWMQSIQALSKLADHAEKMSDFLRLMIAE
jgi:uncharacterized protein